VALAASGRIEAITGRVSISASDGVAAYVLPEVVARIRAEAPQITVVIIASNALSDLQAREADIAVRHVRPDQPGLVGQHLRDTEAHFYASTEWIARYGRPQALADLAGPDLLGFDDTERYSQFLRGIGIPAAAENFRLVSSNSFVVWEMVKRGLGVAAMLREIGDRTPGVERLMPDMVPIPVPVWLVTHRELHTSRRIRLVHDLLAEELRRM